MNAASKPLVTDDGEAPLDADLDFSQATRGKYFEQTMRAKNLVSIDPDLLEAFPTSGELNAALRGLLEASRHVHLKAA